ncbi:nose resistant to fluoxetine protein 6-like [Uranotaenia lowii]|uniref:nose resistant to fluoxetine protein 6-like n=1 Tax=Uranotaenia lowii TaxID=190385 RepID=UPI00247958FF|nr:nose resistant to fluoxetine protein 6-like [Uranotaenia lowii]
MPKCRNGEYKSTQIKSKMTTSLKLTVPKFSPWKLLLLMATFLEPVIFVGGVDFIDFAEYDKFPKIFVYDQFEECQQLYKADYVYCVVHARIQPDAQSQLWQNISIFSRDPSHYDHSLLEYGVCIQNCENRLRSLGRLSENQTRQHTSEHYAAVARECINLQLKSQYQLEVERQVQLYHCYSEQSDNPPVDALEVLFALLLVILFVAVTISTWYDMSLCSRLGFSEKHFSQAPKSKRERVLVSFSFPRNLKRLTESADGQIRQDLQFLEAFRFFQMFRVIMLHVFIAHSKAPQANTNYVEFTQHVPFMIFYIAEFQNYIQTFLSISGMLMTINFLEHVRKNPDYDGSVFWDKLKTRLSRLLPAYFFVVFMEASVARRFMVGPIGHHFVGEGQQNCRDWWWANLLFINNYIRTDSPCLIPMWYMAVDIQLFIFGMLAMLMIWKWPRTKVPFFVLAFACAAIIPTFTSYFKRLAPVMESNMKIANRYNRANDYQLKDTSISRSIKILASTALGCWPASSIIGIVIRKKKFCARPSSGSCSWLQRLCTVFA